MLTARPAFRRRDGLRHDRGDHRTRARLGAAAAQTPPSIRRLLQRCLEKDPKRRLRDIGDARLEIDEALGSVAARRARRRAGASKAVRLRLVGRGGGGVLVIAAATAWQLQRTEYFWRNPLEGATVTKLTDFEGAEHHAAISRDGKFVAFLSDHDGRGTPGSARSGPAITTTSPTAACGSCGIPPLVLLASIRTGRSSLSGVACRIPPGAAGQCRVGGADARRPASALPEGHRGHLRARLVARRTVYRVPPSVIRGSTVRLGARRKGSAAEDL